MGFLFLTAIIETFRWQLVPVLILIILICLLNIRAILHRLGFIKGEQKDINTYVRVLVTTLGFILLLIGVIPLFPTSVKTLGVVPALRVGVVECHRMTVQTFQVIGRLLTRKASIRQVSGPVGIAQISGEAARSGVEALIMLMGIISLQLGIFNLLPIPILDGGHLTVIAVESVIRRDLPLKVKERILEVGFYLLILLMVVVLFNDIVRFLPENVRQFIFRG